MPAREIEQPALAAGCSETLCLLGVFTTGSSAGPSLPSSVESPLVVEVS